MSTLVLFARAPVLGEVKTRLDDLILICANCHRMIHRHNPWLTPDHLRALVRACASVQ